MENETNTQSVAEQLDELKRKLKIELDEIRERADRVYLVGDVVKTLVKCEAGDAHKITERLHMAGSSLDYNGYRLIVEKTEIVAEGLVIHGRPLRWYSVSKPVYMGDLLKVERTLTAEPYEAEPFTMSVSYYPSPSHCQWQCTPDCRKEGDGK